MRQRTIKDKIECVGVGLHTGRRLKLEILPAPADHGITFSRSDLSPHLEIPARIDNVVHTDLATSVGKGKHSIMTVEHLLAALFGLGIDNARVRVNGPEIPILDGSAAPFVYMLSNAGLQTQRRMKRFAVITKPVTVDVGDKHAQVSPCTHFRLTCAINFKHPLVHEQTLELDLSSGSFVRELARARTFGFLKDVEMLKARGLARGGTLDNAVVIDDFAVLNDDGLRYPDEFVRHKALDAIGDMALLGMPIIGHLEVVKGGHSLHLSLLKKILASKAYEVYEASEADQPATANGTVIRLPLLQSA